MDEEIVIDVRDRRKPFVTTLSLASAAGLVAAVAHAAVVREHLAQWWGYGVFFGVVAVVQTAAAVVLYRRPTPRTLVSVVAGNLALISLYTVSRTIGVPLVGPHAGHPEPVGTVDLIATAAEAVQVVAALVLLRRPAGAAHSIKHAGRFALVALCVLAAVAAAVPGRPVHGRGPESRIAIFAAGDVPETPIPHDLHAEETVPPAPGDTPADEPQPAPTCTPHATPGAAESVQSGAVMFEHAGDLWLSSPADAAARRLITDEADCWESAFAFRGAHTITFASDPAIYDLDLRTGRLERLTEELSVADMAWSPDGQTLAYLDWSINVRFYSPSTGKVKTIRNLGEAMGRCGDMSDETSIAWSPDGRFLLVVSTALDNTGDTMYVIDRTGKNIVAPRFGTHARWTSNSSVLFRGFDAPMRWYSLDLGTSHAEPVAMHAGTHHPAVSPDLRYVAYSDDADTPTLYLYDLERNTERALVRGYAAPIWLSATEIAAAKTTACDEDCMMNGWIESGETAAFDLSGKLTRELSVKSTREATVFLAPKTAHATPSPAPEQPSPSPTPSETSSPLVVPIDPSPSPEPSAGDSAPVSSPT